MNTDSDFDRDQDDVLKLYVSKVIVIMILVILHSYISSIEQKQ